VFTGLPPSLTGHNVLSSTLAHRIARRVWRLFTRPSREWDITSTFVRAFAQTRADVILAEYGPTGVRVLEAARHSGIPLVVRFHGYDVSIRSVLKAHEESYKQLLAGASGLIGVSREMVDKLISLGAPSAKVHHQPCGVDCSLFEGGQPGKASPTFLSVGRLVEKKAPHLTIAAFADVWRRRPDARLRIIGDGPLMGVCVDLAAGLGIRDAVTFLGAQPSGQVQIELRRARGFLQHSVEALDGDREGTPVAVIEASSTGLPVVATRHGGIPDVVVDQEMGYLVSERDVTAMSEAILRLVDHPELASELGARGRSRVQARFSMRHSVEHLWRVLASCAPRRSHEPSFIPS
jgi:glycosyltransferase involved in cell wall biosynthesis